MNKIPRKITSNSLSLNNEHLANILDNDEYIEIGSINNKVMNNLIKGKLVKLEDLSCFQIQNIGLGRSEIDLDDEVDNQRLKDMLPYINLDAKIKNHSSSYAIITYGVLIQRVNRKTFSSHEEFTPMVLIPVEMDFSDGISFQMVSLPFTNPYISIVKKANQRSNQVENLNSLYAIDRFFMSYNNFADIRLECYVSHVTIKEEKINFTDKYYHPTLNFYNVETQYNLDNERLVYITNLNKHQRIALERAHDGHSFEIVGPQGTGKTTVLTNIACDAIHNGKRVLYLSSSKNTLEEVYNILEPKGLQNIASKFYLPFNTLKERNVHNLLIDLDHREILDKIANIKKELKGLYDTNEKYIGYLYKRINNYYVIDVINNCLKYKDVNSIIPKEAFTGIDEIYHEEVDNVLDALKLIDENINNIDSIKDSTFSSIPSYVDAYPEDVTSLLRDMNLNYKEIKKIKTQMVNDFGCVNSENYAFLRSLLSNFHGLNKMLVPNAWIKYNETGLYEFEHAKEVLNNFKKEMELLAEKNRLIEEEYNVDILKEINIEKCSSVIYNRFRGLDNKTINKFLKENAKLIEVLDDFMGVMNKSRENNNLMNKALKCNINFSDDDLIEKLIAFMMFIDKQNYSKKWLAINKHEEIKSKIINVKQILDKFDEDKKSLGIVDTKHLSEYIDSLKLKCKIKFKNQELKEYLEKVEALYNDTKGIEAYFDEYLELTGEEYTYEGNPIKNFDKFNKLLEAITDFKVKRGIARLLVEKSISEVREIIIPFIEFGEFYIQVNQKHRLLCGYYLINDKSSFNEKVKDINDSYEYCKKVKAIQDKIKKCIKEPRVYIILEDINFVRKRLNDRHQVEKSIDSNEEYKNLLSPLYHGYDSDIREIERLFTAFDIYCRDFTSIEAVNRSFTSPVKINKVMNECSRVCEEIIDNIKNYTKYFKEEIDKLYYNSIDDVIKYCDSLLKKEDELVVYLNLNRGLNSLEFNGLRDLDDYILNENIKNISYTDIFLKEYYNNLLEMFEKKVAFDINEVDNYQLLYQIVEKENELIDTNVDLMISELKPRYSIISLSNMDYNDYLDKTVGIKSLFLCTPKIFNSFLDASKFDLIIIDDAQTLDAFEYRNALMTNQVIVSGIPQTSFGIKDDLLSIMKRTAIVKLTYRYVETPLSIANNVSQIKTKFPSVYDENKGIIYSRVNVIKMIEEIVNDCDNKILDKKINIYLEDENQYVDLINSLSSLLKRREYSNEEIMQYLVNNINICSLKRNFALEADYTIINLKDYINENDTNEVTNYSNNLLATNKKLIICDDDNLLDSDIDTEFSNRIRKLIKQEINFKKNYADDSVQKVIERLKESDVKVLGAIGNYALILKKHNKLYGVVFFDLESLHESNVLNLYRNIYYGGYIKTISLYLFDLVHDFDGCMSKLLAMMDDNVSDTSEAQQ